MTKDYYFSENSTCPICDSVTVPFDVMDFNRNCSERKGIFLKKSGKPVYYYLCNHCSFLYAPEFQKWTNEDFEKFIYNEEYIKIDPDYIKRRPIANANFLIKTFRNIQDINHLDFGGGNGLCSEYLKKQGWKSFSYDPYSNNNNKNILENKYNLITVFEVFEHHNNPQKLIEDLLQLLSEDGIIVFSTLLSDEYINKKQRINWWYVSPRNGHISIFSQKSLNVLAEKNNLRFGSFESGVHILFKDKLPNWTNFRFI